MSIQVVSGITLLGVMGAGYFLIKYVGKNKESEKEIADTRYNQPQEKIKITKDEVKNASTFINNSNKNRTPQPLSKTTTTTRSRNTYDDDFLSPLFVSDTHKHSYDHGHTSHSSYDSGSSYDSSSSCDSGGCDCGGGCD